MPLGVYDQNLMVHNLSALTCLYILDLPYLTASPRLQEVHVFAFVLKTKFALCHVKVFLLLVCVALKVKVPYSAHTVSSILITL